MLQLQGLTRNSLPDLKMITLERLIKHINEQEHGLLVVVHSVPNQTEHTLPKASTPVAIHSKPQTPS